MASQLSPVRAAAAATRGTAPGKVLYHMMLLVNCQLVTGQKVLVGMTNAVPYVEISPSTNVLWSIVTESVELVLIGKPLKGAVAHPFELDEHPMAVRYLQP